MTEGREKGIKVTGGFETREHGRSLRTSQIRTSCNLTFPYDSSLFLSSKGDYHIIIL